MTKEMRRVGGCSRGERGCVSEMKERRGSVSGVRQGVLLYRLEDITVS